MPDPLQVITVKLVNQSVAHLGTTKPRSGLHLSTGEAAYYSLLTCLLHAQVLKIISFVLSSFHSQRVLIVSILFPSNNLYFSEPVFYLSFLAFSLFFSFSACGTLLFGRDLLAVKYICLKKLLKSVLGNKNSRALTLPGGKWRQEGRGKGGREARGRGR